MPSKKTDREGENYFATREEGEDFQELGARFTLPTRFERFVGSERPIPENVRLGERGRKKTKEKNGRWREEGNSSLRAEMRSVDRPFHSMTIRCQLRISDYFCKKITSGRRGTIPRAVKNRCLQRRTENYPRAIICWTERLSRERKLSGLSFVAEVGRAEEEDARTLTLRR